MRYDKAQMHHDDELSTKLKMCNQVRLKQFIFCYTIPGPSGVNWDALAKFKTQRPHYYSYETKHPHADVNNYTDAVTATQSLFTPFSAASALNEVSAIPNSPLTIFFLTSVM